MFGVKSGFPDTHSRDLRELASTDLINSLAADKSIALFTLVCYLIVNMEGYNKEGFFLFYLILYLNR